MSLEACLTFIKDDELVEVTPLRLSSATLLDLCANAKWLGATPGLTALLHTWTRQYAYHPHVHFIGRFRVYEGINHGSTRMYALIEPID